MSLRDSQSHSKDLASSLCRDLVQWGQNDSQQLRTTGWPSDQMRQVEEMRGGGGRSGDTFSCRLHKTLLSAGGLGPSEHLIRLLSQLEHLAHHLAFSSSRQGHSGVLAHLLEASGLQGSQTPARENETPKAPRAVRQHSGFSGNTSGILL